MTGESDWEPSRSNFSVDRRQLYPRAPLQSSSSQRELSDRDEGNFEAGSDVKRKQRSIGYVYVYVRSESKSCAKLNHPFDRTHHPL